MLPHVQQKVFPFIKDLNGEGTAFTRHMANAVFLIPSANLLYGAIAVIDDIFEIERESREEGHLFQDIQGDVYEMLLMKSPPPERTASSVRRATSSSSSANW